MEHMNLTAEEIMGVAMYQGDIDRTTLDLEWSEEELKGDVYDVCCNILKKWLDSHKNRAVKDKTLLFTEYLVNYILDGVDVIEKYNTLVDEHRHGREQAFGIYYFDTWVIDNANKILDKNLVTGK